MPTVILEVALLPAASRATAAKVWGPFPTMVVFQLVENGAAVSSAPKFAPSRRNCTPATPTLSEAVAFTVTTPDAIAPSEGDTIETVGGWTSISAAVVKLLGALAAIGKVVPLLLG